MKYKSATTGTNSNVLDSLDSFDQCMTDDHPAKTPCQTQTQSAVCCPPPPIVAAQKHPSNCSLYRLIMSAISNKNKTRDLFLMETLTLLLWCTCVAAAWGSVCLWDNQSINQTIKVKSGFLYFFSVFLLLTVVFKLLLLGVVPDLKPGVEL